MRVWGKLKSEDIILQDVTLNTKDFSSAIIAVCEHFDLTKPIICKKHLNEIKNFRRTIFYADDFIETINFDTLEIEIIVNKKKA